MPHDTYHNQTSISSNGSAGQFHSVSEMPIIARTTSAMACRESDPQPQPQPPMLVLRHLHVPGAILEDQDNHIPISNESS